MKRVVSIVLQVSGVAFIVTLSVLVAAYTNHEGKHRVTRLDQVSTELYRGGLDLDQTIEVRGGEVWRSGWLTDFEARWCVGIERFSIAKNSERFWSTGFQGTELDQVIAKDVGLLQSVSDCFDVEPVRMDTLPVTVLSVHLRDTDVGASKSVPEGFEVLVFDPRSKRIAYYGHET